MDIDTQPTTDKLLATAWAHLIQAYDALRAEGQPDAARRALALAKQTERLHGKVVKAENAKMEPVEKMLAIAAEAWGE